MEKKILNRSRIRTVQDGFAFIPHRFLLDGFITHLEPGELLLYLFLILAADAHGLSYYGDSKICRLLKTDPITLAHDRRMLIDKDLIAYESPIYQVLELPRAQLPVAKQHIQVPVIEERVQIPVTEKQAQANKLQQDKPSKPTSSFSQQIARLKERL